MTTKRTTAVQQQTIAATADNWTTTVPFAQFDSSLGTLVDIQFTIAGTLAATASIENLSPAAATVMVSADSDILAVGPFGLSMGEVVVNPFTTTINLGKFDGGTDYKGSSGTVAVMNSMQSRSTIIALGSGLAAQFTGTGTVDLTVSSKGQSTETGNANMQSFLQSSSGAVLSLQYEYVTETATITPGVTTELILPMPSLYPYGETFTLPDRPIGWPTMIRVTQFDPSLDTLLGVYIAVGGHATGTFSVENLGSHPTTFSMTEVATLRVAIPGSVYVGSAEEESRDNAGLAAFDGTLDFSGASGQSAQTEFSQYGSVHKNEVPLFTGPEVLAAFTGTGTIDLAVSTTYTTKDVQKSGDVALETTQQMRGNVAVYYVYKSNPHPFYNACFAAGTGIATPDGIVPVETLTVGQNVTCLNATTAPVIWLGERLVDCSRHPKPQSVWPVRIRAGAFADNVPARDLFLSPDHAVFVDDMLIPVRYLLNGASIAQVETGQVHYYHVELSMHDVLLAEGLPVESYLETGTRGGFANGGGPVELNLDFSALTWDASACAPLIVIGAGLDRVRARLAARQAASQAALLDRPPGSVTPGVRHPGGRHPGRHSDREAIPAAA